MLVRRGNINDVLGLYPLEHSLVIWSYVRMLVRRVLSDRYRTTQEQLQYHRAEIYITMFRA